MTATFKTPRHPAAKQAAPDIGMQRETDLATHATGLTIRSLGVSYRGAPVLADLTLPTLQPGRVVGLLGANGAGKSTLLKAMAGLVQSTGELAWQGRPLRTMPASERAHCIGYMPQQSPDDLDVTVLDGLVSILQLDTRTQAGDARPAPERALDSLERLGILGLALKPLRSLSGGQRQMANLAQAIASDPAVLLLDEPTSALDLRHQVSVMRTVRSLARDGRLVVAVLHDLNLAARWMDDVIVLRQGALCAAGTPAQALTPAVLAQAYGVRARVERCSLGNVTVMTDADIDDEDSRDAAP